MDAVIKQEAKTPSISAVVAFVASQVLELERLRAAKQTIADYRATYAQVTANLIRTQSRMEAIDPELQRAGARVIKSEQEESRHKGLMQRLWQLVSPAATFIAALGHPLSARSWDLNLNMRLKWAILVLNLA